MESSDSWPRDLGLECKKRAQWLNSTNEVRLSVAVALPHKKAAPNIDVKITRDLRQPHLQAELRRCVYICRL